MYVWKVADWLEFHDCMFKILLAIGQTETKCPKDILFDGISEFHLSIFSTGSCVLACD